MRIVTWSAIAAVCFLGVLPLPTARAHTTQGVAVPSNDGKHPWASHPSEASACSVPEGVQQEQAFNHACKHHDGCYEGFPRDGKPTYWVSRKQCDDWFGDDMGASCLEVYLPPVRTTCIYIAAAYQTAVRHHGYDGYRGPAHMNYRP